MDINRKLKTRLHFNRVNMQRKKPEVWTASNSRACHQAEKLVVMHKGKVLLETVFAPDKPQPRAYFVARANVKIKDGVAVVEV